MAFDHGDSDAIYDRVIEPVLRRNAITPVIINRRESNEDLNNQIITELDSCNLCIADLTYTRPSVYFEAGYAQRVVPVIYTVRSDHLLKGQPDDLRVHFDLQMKPLVRWKSPRDSDFGRRLERRLRSTFLRTWNRRTRLDERLEKERSAFTVLPLARRLILLRRRAVLELRRFGFRAWTVTPMGDALISKVSELATKSAVLVSRRRHDSTLTIVTVAVFPSLAKRELEQLGHLTSALFFLGDIRDQPGRLREVVIHNVVITLRPIPPNRLESALTHLARADRPGLYERRDLLGDLAGTGRQVPLLATFTCLADPRSESEFRLHIRETIGHLLTKGAA